MTVKAPSLSLVCLYAREKGSPLKSLSAKLGILSQPKKSQVSLKIPFEDSPVKADMFWHSSVLTLYHAGTCSSWHFQKTLTSVFSQVKSAFQIRTFVAKQEMSRIRAFLVWFSLRFDSTRINATDSRLYTDI